MTVKRELHDAPTYALGLAILLAVLPVLTQQYVPLVDYPNHVARSYIFAHYEDVASFRSLYERSFVPIPNMAADVVLGVLMLAAGADIGSRIFLALIIVLYAASVVALSKAVWGRVTWFGLPAVFLVFSSPFLYGFVNYVMSLAIAQLTLAGWLVYRRQWTVTRVVLCIAGALATYLAHLAGFAILGVAAGAVALDSWRGDRSVRRVVRDIAPLCVPLPLWLAFRAQGGQLGVTRWASWGEKGIGLFALVRSYHSIVDVIVVATLALVVAMVLKHRRNVEWSRTSYIAGGALLLAFAISPIEAFTGSAVDQRFVPPALLLALLGISLRPEFPHARLVHVACLAAVLIRFGDIWLQWRRVDPAIQASIAVGDRLPRASRVYPVYVAPIGRDAEKQDRGFLHVLLYSLPDRELFVPTLFAMRGQQPVVFSRSSICPKCGRQMAPTIEDVDRLVAAAPSELQGYTHLWVHGPETDPLKRLTAACCERLAGAGKTSIWRIKPEFFRSQ